MVWSMTKAKVWPSDEEAIARLTDSGRIKVRPFPHNPAYWVSEGGRVMNFRKTGWLKACALKRGGYLGVGLWTDGKGKMTSVHRIVAITFHGDPPSPKHDAAHLDGNRQNNWDWNLAWKTRKENEADKVLHGRSNRGERNGMAKLTNAQCEQIKRDVVGARHGDKKRIASRYGITASALGNILAGRRRLHAS